MLSSFILFRARRRGAACIDSYLQRRRRKRPNTRDRRTSLGHVSKRGEAAALTKDKDAKQTSKRKDAFRMLRKGEEQQRVAIAGAYANMPDREATKDEKHDGSSSRHCEVLT